MRNSGKRWRWAAAAAAAVVVAVAVVLLAGSGGDSGKGGGARAAAPNVVQAGAPGQPSRKLSEDALDDVETPKHTAADVRFMQGMLHHHDQALVMAGYVAERSTGRDLPLFAKRLKLSQESEMELIRKWLRDRDEALPGHGHELMPGMLTEAQLARLEGARGRRFNRLFLRAMIRHHEGALTMIRELHDANGGLEPEIDRFVRHVEADQGIEIARMRQLLADGA